jgi:hypothetical protein
MRVKLLIPGLQFLDGSVLTKENIGSVVANFSAPVPITMGPPQVERCSTLGIGNVTALCVVNGELIGTCEMVPAALGVAALETPCAIILFSKEKGTELIGALMSNEPMIQDAILEG